MGQSEHPFQPEVTRSSAGVFKPTIAGSWSHSTAACHEIRVYRWLSVRMVYNIRGGTIFRQNRLFREVLGEIVKIIYSPVSYSVIRIYLYCRVCLV